MMKITFLLALAMLNACLFELIFGGWQELNGASRDDFNLAVWATQQLTRFFFK
jgi:hypothetical protein